MNTMENTQRNQKEKRVKGSQFENEFKTETKVVKNHWDRILEDSFDQLKQSVKGSSNVENWKIAGLGVLGVINPTLAGFLAVVYIWISFLLSDLSKLDLEEGYHYETETREYRVKE